MIRIRLVIGALFFLSTTCLQAANLPKYPKFAHKIIRECSKDLKKDQGLYLIGSGGQMAYDIKTIAVHYQCFHALNVEETRKLFVQVTENYISKVNFDANIRPFLHNFPFRFDNMDIMIGFDDSKGGHCGDGSVALVFLSKRTNEIVYEGYNCETQKFYSLHREPYEVALKIVSKQEPPLIKQEGVLQGQPNCSFSKMMRYRGREFCDEQGL